MAKPSVSCRWLSTFVCILHHNHFWKLQINKQQQQEHYAWKGVKYEYMWNLNFQPSHTILKTQGLSDLKSWIQHSTLFLCTAVVKGKWLCPSFWASCLFTCIHGKLELGKAVGRAQPKCERHQKQQIWCWLGCYVKGEAGRWAWWLNRTPFMNL